MTELRYKCLSCGSVAEKLSDKLSCSRCGREWKIESNIVRLLDNNYYWGEIPEDKLKEINSRCRRGYWADVISDEFESRDLWRFKSIADCGRANWLKFLDFSFYDMALDIGAGMGVNTEALAKEFDRVVSIDAVGTRLEFTAIRVAQEGLDNVDFIQSSVFELPFFEDTFDLISMIGIVEWLGEWQRQGRPRDVQLKCLQDIYCKLKKHGKLLIGIENRFGYQYFKGGRDHNGLRYTSLMPRSLASLVTEIFGRDDYRSFYRTKVKREYRTYTYTISGYSVLLQEAGFKDIRFYFPHPNYNIPYRICSLENKKILLDFLRKLSTSGDSKKEKLRTYVAKTLVATGLFKFFVPGYLIIATKEGNIT